MVTLNPLELLNITINGTLIFGFIICIPYLTYIVYKYIKDALYINEKNIIKNNSKFLFLPLIGSIFGLITTHFIILPFLMGLMKTYNISNMLGLNLVIKFYIINALIMTFIFSIPIIIKIMNKLNIITKKTLTSKRKIFYVISLLIIGIITPTTDMFSLLIMGVPTLLIYELSILMIKKTTVSTTTTT